MIDPATNPTLATGSAARAESPPLPPAKPAAPAPATAVEAAADMTAEGAPPPENAPGAPAADVAVADAEADATDNGGEAVQAAGNGGEAIVSEDQVKAVLRRVKDPELNLNIVDLGLVYGVAVAGTEVSVDMSLTSPGCPSGPEIMGEAEKQVRTMPGVTDVKVNLVWTPFWSPDRIEPRVRAYLGF